MVKHPSASVNPVTNQGRIRREQVLLLILFIFVKSRLSIIWLEGIFTERFLSKPNRVHLKYDKSYHLPYTRCSFTVSTTVYSLLRFIVSTTVYSLLFYSHGMKTFCLVVC